jgi:outer membrane protein TolC
VSPSLFRSFGSLHRWLTVIVAAIGLVGFFLPNAHYARAQGPVPQARDTLSAEQVVERVLADNPEGRIARTDAAIAANDAAASTAGLLPTLSAQAGYSGTLGNTQQEFISGETVNRTGAQSTSLNASAELRWTLFDGLGRFATLNRLQSEAQRQAARARDQVDALLAEALVTYYAVARQQQELSVRRTAVDLSRERLRIARLRREVGTASDLEVRRALVDLNADSAAVLRQRADLTATKATLNRLLGRPDAPETFAVTDSVAIDEALSMAGLRSTAMARNPALQAAKANLQAARQERRALVSDYLPQVDATVGYGYSRLTAESGFLQFSQSTDLTYGLSVTFDLFSGLNRPRRVRNADLRTRTAELAIDDIQTRVRTRLTRAFERYQSRLRLVELERENLAAARQNVDAALEQFRAGTITSLELREVQEQRVQAESRLLTAQFEAKQAEVELLQISGRLRARSP